MAPGGHDATKLAMQGKVSNSHQNQSTNKWKMSHITAKIQYKILAITQHKGNFNTTKINHNTKMFHNKEFPLFR